MELKQAMRLRASCRDYQSVQVTDAQLNAVLDAACLAPTGMAKYEDMQLIVVQDGAKLDQLNAMAAKVIGDPDARPTYGAPTLIFVCDKIGVEDLLAGANVGCVMENMMLAASDEGLASCYLFGICRMLEKNEEAQQLIGVPEGFRIVSAIAFGVPSETPAAREADRSKIVTIR